MNLEPLLNQLSIIDTRAHLIPFKLNWAQKEMLAEVQRQYDERRIVRVITLKARQLGISTLTEAIMFLYCFIFSRVNGLVIAHETSSAQHLLSMTQTYWDSYTFRSLYSTKYKSRNELSWVETDSSLKVSTAKNTDTGRSKTLQMLHASEVAFWDHANTTMGGLDQAFHFEPDTFGCIESTANGVGGFFHDQWQAAVEHETEYTPLFFPWWRHPQYTWTYLNRSANIVSPPVGHMDEEERVLAKLGVDSDHLLWRRWAIRNLCQSDLALFHQEYPSCVTGDTRVGTTEGLICIDQARVGMTATYGEVKATHPQPISPTYKLTTSLGYTLQGTWDHPVVLESGILCPLQSTVDQTVELGVPQFSLSYYVETWHECGTDCEVLIDEDWGRFLGLFMGDGSFYKNTLEIACTGTDVDVVEECQRLIEDLFNLDSHTRVVGSKGGGIGVRVTNHKLKELFDRMGMLYRNDKGKGSVKRRVHVPECIWRSPKSVIAEFLSGLFEADGFNHYLSPNVKLFAKDEQFLKDIQLLLLGFGITSRRTRVVKKAGNGHEYWGNELTLRSDEATKFNNKIGFISDRKTFNIERVAGRGRSPAPITLADKVVSVELCDPQITYDLTVQDDAVFDANGIVTHNTPEEAFVATGYNVFPLQHLRTCYEPIEHPLQGRLMRRGATVQFVPDIAGPLKMYVNAPSNDHEWGKYMVAGDPTRVTTGDFAVGQVINRRTFEQVAVWRGRIDGASFGEQMAMLGTYFNNALLTVETTGAGYTAMGALIQMNYPNLYKHRYADREPTVIATQYGWDTNEQRKQWMIGFLLKLVVDHVITIHDATTMFELTNYVTLPNGGFGANSTSGFDDTVTALAQACVCSSTEILMAYEGPHAPKEEDNKTWQAWNEEPA